MSNYKFSSVCNKTVFLKAADKFLNSYISPAFGALPKSEIDLLVLEFLESIGYIDKQPSIYHLTTKLKVTRTKSRKLIYDRELRKSSPEDLDCMVIDLLTKPILNRDGKYFFILEIENPLLSDHLRAKVASLGYVSDGSFSPNLVKLPLDAIVALIDNVLSDNQKELARAALIEAGAPDGSFKGILKGALNKFASKLANEAGEAGIKEIGEFMKPILESPSSIVSRWRSIFD